MVDFAEPAHLTPDRFCEEAISRTGLSDFGDPSYLEGLTLVCAGMRGDHMSVGGRRLLADTSINYLANRLRVINHHRQDPGLVDTPVDAPIVILGLPRTGTTVLSYLLDQDPQWRSLLNWEAVNSVPPPTSETLRTDPRCVELLEFQEAVLPNIDPPPPHWEWADGPTECTFLLAQDFKAAMWESRVPSADYRDFIAATGMTSAYRYHRMALQVLQSKAPGTWVLKMPAHAYFIDALLDAYPDARIIWTHRDPATSAASFMNLLAFSHTLSMGAPDRDWIASTTPDRLVDQVRRPMTALAGRHENSVCHVHYRDAMANPLGEVERIYDWLGIDFTDAAATAMVQWLTADPLAASRKASYTLADFGLDRAELLEQFEDYINAFDVELD